MRTPLFVFALQKSVYGWMSCRRSRKGLYRKVIVLGALISASLALVNCNGDEKRTIDHFGYAVSTPLLTTNAGSKEGASTGADLLVSRLYPGVFVPGPSGQMIPNLDIASAQLLPGPVRRVEYSISQSAVYSDGAPITCTDFLLAQKAVALPQLFESYASVLEQVDSVECVPGAKEFTVVFKQGMGARWRQLFSAGTVLPSHAIAQKVGKNEEELATALKNNDVEALRPVADVWNTGFRLANFDPQLQVASGPFKISEADAEGGVKLVPNESYSGDKPALPEIIMWPKGVDLSSKAKDNSVEIADVVGEKDISWLNRDDPKNPFTTEQNVGDMNEQLVLATAGVFGADSARQAFAACIDATAVAQVSSDFSGVKVPALGTRLTTGDDPVNQQTSHIAEAHLHPDLLRAEELRGQTIRVGYVGPDGRKTAMVEKIRASCGQAGINVVDASAEAGNLQDLAVMTKNSNGKKELDPRRLDAVLVALDPLTQFGNVDATVADIEALRAAEEKLWAEVPTIPLASQPHTFVIDRTLTNVVVNTSSSGIGWNMDRWQERGKK